VVLAEEAAAMGLVNRVVPAESVLAETMAYAQRMAAETSPSSLLVLKRQLWAGLDEPHGQAVSRSVDLMLRMIAGPDFKEGTSAFQAKRPPDFPSADRSYWVW
jgi:enoyl-CoA hydratase/carnithine racemase